MKIAVQAGADLFALQAPDVRIRQNTQSEPKPSLLKNK
jgi:hypothetical protein